MGSSSITITSVGCAIALIVATAAQPVCAVTPSYVYANSACTADRPWLIGYARFTHKAVCTNVCPPTAQWCTDFQHVHYYPSQVRPNAPSSQPKPR